MAKAKKSKPSRKSSKKSSACHGGLLNAGKARPTGYICNGTRQVDCNEVSRKMRSYFSKHKPKAAC